MNTTFNFTITDREFIDKIICKFMSRETIEIMGKEFLIRSYVIDDKWLGQLKIELHLEAV